jgi:1,4-alpha-glucan branching enzyme
VIETLPDGNGRVRAIFRLEHVVGIRRISVVGEFNDWSPEATVMEQRDDCFVAEVRLRPGRSYRFRYLLDDSRWENDWAADSYTPNEFGGDDSVIDLTNGPRRAGIEGQRSQPPNTQEDPWRTPSTC